MEFHAWRKATGVHVLWAFAVALVLPILAPYLRTFGFSNVELSLLMGIAPLVMVLTSPISGHLSDLLGRSKVIHVGVVGRIIGMMLFILGTTMLPFGAARILDGLAGVAVGIATLARIQDVLPSRKRGTYSGISLSIAELGRMIAPVIGGLLADFFFVRAPFVASILVMLAVFFLVPYSKNHNHIQRQDLNWFKNIKKFWANKKLRGMGVLGMVMHASAPATLLFLPLLITETFGLGFRHVGFAFFVLQLPLLLQFWFGRWCDKNSYYVVRIGTVLAGLFLVALAFAPSYALILGVLFLVGIGSAMFNVSAWTLMSNIGEKNKKEGEVIGTYLAVAKMGSVVAWLTSGFIVTAYSISALFAINGLVIVLGTLVSFSMLKK